MKFRVVTLFPDLVTETTKIGVCGRAARRGLIDVAAVDPREFTDDIHRSVDDRPYGGGPGMVLKVAPVRAAIRQARGMIPTGCPVVFLTPQGRRFDQAVAQQFAALPGMVLVAGRYEGFDERLLDSEADDEISLGDFVLSGGEIAAVAVIDAVVRLLPGVLGDETSAEQDSFMDGLLDCPHYTRPETVDDRAVPAVLLEGNHEEIRRWRLKQALGRTYLRRPDLLQGRELSDEEQRLLREFLDEQDLPPAQDAPVRH